MIFKRERNLSNKVFKTKIKFKAYGGAMSPEDEKQLFENLGHPTIDMGGSYQGYFVIDDGKITRVEENGENVAEVEIVLNSNPVKVNGNFSQEFIADGKKEEPVDPLILGSQVAEAKCILFEDEVDKKLKEAIEDMTNKETDFEEGFPEEVVIPPEQENQE